MLAVAAVNRLVMALATLFGVAVVVFVLLRVVPGDPIAMMIARAPAPTTSRRSAPATASTAPSPSSSWSG